MSLCRELFGDTSWSDLTAEQRCAYHREWASRNRERRKAYARSDAARAARRAYHSRPDVHARRRAYMKEWAKKNYGRYAAKYRRYRLKVEYGLTLQQYESMVAAQGGCCALCGASKTASETSARKHEPLHVDHDHATGKVRALLCHHCNMMLGHCKDNPDLLRKAAAYVEEHRG